MTFENVDGFTNYNHSHNDGLEPLSTWKLNEISKIIVYDELWIIPKINNNWTDKDWKTWTTAKWNYQ